MIWIIVLLLVLLLAALRCRRGHEKWAVLRQYRYAHRGLHQKPAIPENSMAAFRLAVEGGFGAELDVHLMKDGSLAVIHDSSLKRTAGADVFIEDLTREELGKYALEESTERIPLLEEVLDLFRGRTPLIIELKAEGGNHAALSEAVAKVLDGYQGDYCIESFDPRVVKWFRENRPQVCRGQLSQNFLCRKEGNLRAFTRFLLTNLLGNLLTVPDFIAYRFEDRKGFGVKLCRIFWRPQMVHWTLTRREDLEQAEKEGALGIFEQFVP